MAYGIGVGRAIENVAAVLAIPSRLAQCLVALDADLDLIEEIAPLLAVRLGV